VVSDRVTGHQVGRASRTAEELVHPQGLIELVQQTAAAAAVQPARDLFPFFRLTPEQAAGREPVRVPRTLLDSFAAIHAGVRLNASLGLRLWREVPTDLLAVYLEAPDAVLHLFGEYEPPRRPGVDEVGFERYREVGARYLAFLDEWLGRFLDALGPRDTLVVVSDHGFRSGDARPAGPATAGSGHAPAWHHREGLYGVYGAGARAATSAPPASIHDVAPTVLRLLDLPLAADLAGQVMEDALSTPVRQRPLRQVASYGPPERPGSPAALPEDPSAEGRIALLRSLGYLGAASGTTDGSGEEATLQETYNRGLVLLLAGDLDAAEAAFREVEPMA